MTAVTSQGGSARIEAASWLERSLLVALMRFGPGWSGTAGWRLSAERDGELTALDTRWFVCHPAAEDQSDTSQVVTVAFPAPAEGAPVALVADDGNESHRLDWESIEASLGTTTQFAEACRGSLDLAGRIRAAGFLAATPRAHRINYTPDLGERLMTIRDTLREPLPVSKVGPGVASAMRVESVLAVDECAFWLVGWLHASQPRDALLTAVSPEGVRAVPRRGAVTFSKRPDLSRVFADDPVPTVGFAAYVELDSPSHRPTGWILEVRTAAPDAIQDVARAPVINDFKQLRRRLVEERLTRVDDAVLSNQILATVTRLAARPESGRIEEIVEYGQLPQTPEVSIVIATAAIDRIEHQVLEFARDPEMARVELVYAVDRDDDGGLGELAGDLSSLHRLAFRVVRVSAATSRARTFNLGASVASGRLLVLMSGDVLPTEPGWLQVMSAFLDADPSVGAVGPMLLHEDGSIAHAGASFVRQSDPHGFKLAQPLRGLAPTLPAALTARPVQAVSDACMMVAADRFRRLGGLSELYLEHGQQPGDLCLAIAQEGLQIWYLPDARLHILERDSRPPGSGDSVGEVFDAWLLDSRWGKLLAGATADPEQIDAVAATVPIALPFPGAGSGRPGSPAEVVEIMSAELDGSTVLDGAVLRAPPVSPRHPYHDTYSFVIEGWAIPREGGPLSVEALAPGAPARRSRASLPSADGAARYPDTPGAATSGFQFVLGSLALPLEFELDVDAVTEDGARAGLGRIRGRRRPLHSGYTPELQPLLVTTLGRTGSSWFLTLLSKHPEIVALHPFQYEARLTSYWMEALHALAEPASYMQSIRPEIYTGDWWIGGRRTNPLPVEVIDSEMPRWLGCENVETLAGFCQSRLDAFYRELARVEAQGRPRYFAEKCVPGPAPRSIGELYPDGREVLLVRDLRDMVCSILDYNAKRGFALWGRDESDSEDAWLRYMRSDASRMLDSLRERRDRVHLVRYEDLITEPERTLAAVFSYLGVDRDAGTVRRAIEEAMALTPHAQAAHRTSASVAASIGRWERELSQGHRAACAELLDDIQLEFGYEPTSSSATHPDLTPTSAD